MNDMSRENFEAGFAIMYTVCSLICLGCLYNHPSQGIGDGTIICLGLAMFLFMIFAIYHSGRINNR